MRHHRQSGVTLLELLAVLLIIGILTAILAPKLPDGKSIALSAQAQSFAADLRRAQTVAMSTGKAICLKRLGATTQYGIYDTTKTVGGDSKCTETSVPDPVTGSPISLLRNDPLTGQPASFSIDNGFSFAGNNCVIFNSVGKIYSPSTPASDDCSTASTSAAQFCIKNGPNDYRIITVEALSGIIKVEDRTAALPAKCTS